MFFGNQTVENFQHLIEEIKKYLALQKEYTKVELTEKLTILLATLVTVLLVSILGMIALFYFMFAIAYMIEPYVGGLGASFGIITGFCLFLLLLLYIYRKKIIFNPMVNFLARLFLNDSNE